MPVPLRGPNRVRMSAGETVQIVATGAERRDARFRVDTVGYFYQLATAADPELLGFHWTPDAIGVGAVSFPHLHIGPAIIAGQAAIRPKDLHKAHIPTGVVSLAAIVRLAITEFGVEPLRSDWARVLALAEAAPAGAAPG